MKLLKLVSALLPAIMLFSCNNTPQKNETVATDTIVKDTAKAKTAEAPKEDVTVIYEFKGKEPYINTEYVKNCSEQEKALLAYYCYFFNTSCKDSKHCMLTEALGLGQQNSKEHKALVLKWFTDEETLQMVKESKITANGSKSMSWFEEINLIKKGADLMQVRYASAWKTDKLEGKGKGSDEYQFTAEKIKVIGRQHEDL